MNEEFIEEIIPTQLTDLESLSTTETIIMNDDERIDPDLVEIMQQQPIIPITDASVNTSSTEMIPTVTADPVTDDVDDLPIEDETIIERIIALKDMFPEILQNTVGKINRALINTSKLAYNKGRSTAWWITSSMCVLVFPILIQKELLQIAQQISQEQRSILLGPQAATGALSGGAF